VLALALPTYKRHFAPGRAGGFYFSIDQRSALSKTNLCASVPLWFIPLLFLEHHALDPLAQDGNVEVQNEPAARRSL
jgi:hypothetical protein